MSNVIDIRYCKEIFEQILAAIQSIGGDTDEIETKLQSIIDELVILNLNDFATEATLVSVNSNVDGIEPLLTTLNAKDFATQATLLAIQGFVDGIETLLTTLNAKDFATETTLNLIRLHVDTLETLISFSNTKLTSIDNKVATESTLSLIEAQTSQLTFTGSDLNVNASFAGESKFGDNVSVFPVVAAVISQLLSSANTNRKEVYIVNNSNKKMWIAFGVPKPFGQGIPLLKDEILIEDVYRGDIYGIWDTVPIGNAQITQVLV